MMDDMRAGADKNEPHLAHGEMTDLVRGEKERAARTKNDPR